MPICAIRLTSAALSLAAGVDYSGAGTVEFLLDAEGNIYFLEMNTRLQVEHPVSEWVTGIDMVQAQLRIAASEPLWLEQEDVQPRGHAIECRLYAEDAERDFAPSPGHIDLLRTPDAPWVRFDSGIREGFTVPLEYDPMLAKLSVWGETREQARRRMIAALSELAILGPKTTGPFLIDVLAHPAFTAGETNTAFLGDHFPQWKPGSHDLALAAAVAAIHRPPARGAPTAGEVGDPDPWQTLGAWRSFEMGRKP